MTGATAKAVELVERLLAEQGAPLALSKEGRK
jgi:hypothetical protein